MRTHHSLQLQARLVVAGMLIGSAVACSTGLSITTRYMPGFDSKGVQSFAVERTDLSLRPSWVDAQIRMDLERVLTSKGYMLNDSFGADMLVSFQVQRRESYPVQLPGRREPPSITFQEGSLTLEIRDAFNQQVYRGVARDVVAQTKDETRQRLRAAVNQLLDDFPATE